MTYVLIFLVSINGIVTLMQTNEPVSRAQCELAAKAMVEAHVTTKAKCIEAGEET